MTNHLAACTIAGTPPSVVADPKARLRIAHLGPDAPDVDVCLAESKGGAYAGPVLRAAGLVAGASYKQVTTYLELKPARYFARLVAAGATDCSAALAPSLDYLELPELLADTRTTIAAIGSLAGGRDAFRLKAYVDEDVAPSGKAKLRVVHASPGTPAVDVGPGRGLSFTAAFAVVPFGEIETGVGISNGYLSLNPVSNAVFSARVADGLTDVLTVGGLSLPEGAVATAFAIGFAGDAQTPLEVLVCSDGASNGLLSECGIAGAAPAPAQLRVAHLAPDAPAVDVCIADKGSTHFRGPILAKRSVAIGLKYPQVSTYLPLSAGAYDVRIVAPGSTDCLTSLAGLPDVTDLPTLGDGVSVTVAATGLLVPGVHNPFKVRAYVDELTGPTHKANLRFIHASPDAPNVDLGLGTGASYVPLFLDVAFGEASAYLARDPITAHSSLTVRLTGTPHDVLTVTGLTVAATRSATVFAIGTVSGAAPLKALFCRDEVPASGLLSTCLVAP